MPRKETEIAAAVLKWLGADGWDCYPEVSWRGQARADIVAVRGPLLWVIETKTSLGLKVISQARYWLRLGALMASIAVPKQRKFRRSGADRELAKRVCEWLGVGMLTVGSVGSISEPIPARLHRGNRDLSRRIADYLTPEMKRYTAGNAESRYWTPFKETVRRARMHISVNQGCTVKDLVDSIRHHYASSASARQYLVEHILEGRLPGVRAEKDGKIWRLYFEKGEGR